MSFTGIREPARSLSAWTNPSMKGAPRSSVT